MVSSMHMDMDDDRDVAMLPSDEIIKAAKAAIHVDADAIFISPVTGIKKKGDFTEKVIFDCYEELIRNKMIYIGDIAVSYEIINSRAKKNIFLQEFDKAWVHGFLHLMGYDHLKNKDYIKMNKIEKRILNLI